MLRPYKKERREAEKDLSLHGPIEERRAQRCCAPTIDGAGCSGIMLGLLAGKK
jgi:hypothetical protein